MERKEDGWWFAIRDIECGPYVTKHEAIEDLQGLKRFLREHPEFGKSDTVFDPTLCPFFSGASVMPTATATKSSAKKSSSAKASKPSTKSAAKPSAKAEKGSKKYGPLRIATIAAMQKLKATSATSARTAADIAGATGGAATESNVKHYCGVSQMQEAGLVAVADLEGVRGNSYYLTAVGAKLDPRKLT